MTMGLFEIGNPIFKVILEGGPAGQGGDLERCNRNHALGDGVEVISITVLAFGWSDSSNILIGSGALVGTMLLLPLLVRSRFRNADWQDAGCLGCARKKNNHISNPLVFFVLREQYA